MNTWTFDGYWRTVLGLGSAADIATEFDLAVDGLDEWLGHAEAEAWAMGGEDGDLPEAWAGFHARALEALQDAIGEAT